MQFDGELIVSGSRDSTLRVWEVYGGEIKHVLSGHTEAVIGVKLVEQRAVSCSSDKTLRVWDLIRGTCQRVLEVNDVHSPFV